MIRRGNETEFESSESMLREQATALISTTSEMSIELMKALSSGRHPSVMSARFSHCVRAWNRKRLGQATGKNHARILNPGVRTTS